MFLLWFDHETWSFPASQKINAARDGHMIDIQFITYNLLYESLYEVLFVLAADI